MDLSCFWGIQKSMSNSYFTIMSGTKVCVRSNGDNTKWIDGRMATIVMLLYVVHIHCIWDSWNLINILSIIEQIWILPYQLLVAFEMDGIHLRKSRIMRKLILILTQDGCLNTQQIKEKLIRNKGITSSNRISVTKSRISDSVKTSPHKYLCFSRIVSHLSNVL